MLKDVPLFEYTKRQFLWIQSCWHSLITPISLCLNRQTRAFNKAFKVLVKSIKVTSIHKITKDRPRIKLHSQPIQRWKLKENDSDPKNLITKKYLIDERGTASNLKKLQVLIEKAIRQGKCRRRSKDIYNKYCVEFIGRRFLMNFLILSNFGRSLPILTEDLSDEIPKAALRFLEQHEKPKPTDQEELRTFLRKKVFPQIPKNIWNQMKRQEENPRFNISACIEKTLQDGGTYEYFREKILERKRIEREFAGMSYSVPLSDEVTKEDWWNEVILEALKPENGSMPLSLQIIKERGCKTRLLSKTKAALSAILTKVNDQATTLCKNIKGIREGYQLHSKNASRNSIGAHEVLNTLTEFGRYPVRSFYESDCSEATDHINPEYARIIIEELANCLQWTPLEKEIALKTVSKSHDDRYFIIKDYDITETKGSYTIERNILPSFRPDENRIKAEGTQTQTRPFNSEGKLPQFEPGSIFNLIPPTRGGRGMRRPSRRMMRRPTESHEQVRTLQPSIISTPKCIQIPSVHFNEVTDMIETIKPKTSKINDDIKEPKKLQPITMSEVNPEDWARIKELKDHINLIISQGQLSGTIGSVQKPTNRELFIDFHQLVDTGETSMGNPIYVRTYNKLLIETPDGFQPISNPIFLINSLRNRVLELHDLITELVSKEPEIEYLPLCTFEIEVEYEPYNKVNTIQLQKSWADIESEHPSLYTKGTETTAQKEQPSLDLSEDRYKNLRKLVDQSQLFLQEISIIKTDPKTETNDITVEYIDGDPNQPRYIQQRRIFNAGEIVSKIEKEIKDKTQITPTTKSLKKDSEGNSYLELTYPQTSGTQMGLRLSFPILCLLHLYACYKAGDWHHSCIFGDDLIANWDLATISRYLGEMGKLGFKMNKKKEFFSKRISLFCGTYLDFKHREILKFPEYKSILSTKTDSSFDKEFDRFIRIKEVNNIAVTQSSPNLAKRVRQVVNILYFKELQQVKKHCPLYIPELYGGFGLLPFGKHQTELTLHMKLIFNSSPYKDRIQISKGITSCWQKSIQDTDLREIEYLTADFLEEYSSPYKEEKIYQEASPETSSKIQEVTEHLRSAEQYWVHEGRSKLNYTKQTVWDCIKRINLKLRSILTEYEQTPDEQPIMYNIKDIQQMNVSYLKNRCSGFNKIPELPLYLNLSVSQIINELLKLDAITVIETLKLLKESDKAFVEKLTSIVNQERLLSILQQRASEVDLNKGPITPTKDTITLFGHTVSIKA